MSLNPDTLLKLDTAFLEDGIRSTHFFNGRLLSSEDLRQEQEAHHAALQQLGRMQGEGISSGLHVTAELGASSVDNPIVTVEPGLATNRLGQVLELSRRVRVSLLGGSGGDTPASSTSGHGDFRVCSRPESVYVAGTGVYLLVLAPAEGTEGKALVSGLGNTNAPCNAKRRVEGVRFRLLRVDVNALELKDTSYLRNRLAHHCFGTTDPKLQAALAHPFGVIPEQYGLLDAHRPLRLTDCDVPLALIHWEDTSGIRFVDVHSVRRRPTRRMEPGRWDAHVGERRASEAEALFLQFQEHLESLAQRVTADQVRAVDHFVYLPPSGVLPLRSGLTQGFDSLRFFKGLTVRGPMFIEGARLAPLLHQARSFPPLALHRPEHELIWLYHVRENLQAPSGPGQSQPYLVFVSGHVPYQGDARFDVARWSFSHYALDVPAPGERTEG
ncbi:hypothetical protein ATI61_11378 [Archangium gephyra]|uniref:Uncharacterized protein n=1 Tax=Archangium gephyra TaxID=48 RepID=A0AAC8Q8Q8_9BACT|nr:hypothetical protein [Archangium gephyra]AKJ02889.1 Hypothetical protein AA314_04515 [Archangium gephyra]REG25015.1 hypothetical protein ATI61_11378 [Archangium gephyra]